jgi:hypothetical protein
MIQLLHLARRSRQAVRGWRITLDALRKLRSSKFIFRVGMGMVCTVFLNRVWWKSEGVFLEYRVLVSMACFVATATLSEEQGLQMHRRVVLESKQLRSVLKNFALSLF